MGIIVRGCHRDKAPFCQGGTQGVHALLSLNSLPNYPTFLTTLAKAKLVGKGENAINQHFYHFLHVLLIQRKRKNVDRSLNFCL